MKSKLEDKLKDIAAIAHYEHPYHPFSQVQYAIVIDALLATLRECRKQRNEKLKAYLTVHPCPNISGMTIDEEVRFEAESDDNKLLKILE